MEKIQPKDEKNAFERRIFPEIDEWSVLTVSCAYGHYSASRIAHAVEDSNCHLLNLNVTAGLCADTAQTVVELRVSTANPESVARSLERYGYEVIAVDSSSSSAVDDVTRERIEGLMRFLRV